MKNDNYLIKVNGLLLNQQENMEAKEIIDSRVCYYKLGKLNTYFDGTNTYK